jgi:hypothetical protein
MSYPLCYVGDMNMTACFDNQLIWVEPIIPRFRSRRGPTLLRAWRLQFRKSTEGRSHQMEFTFNNGRAARRGVLRQLNGGK